jgi:hypothetical protein
MVKSSHETGWISGPKGAYKAAARLHPPATSEATAWAKDYMLLQVGPKNSQGGYLRLEWNPDRFTPAQRSSLFKQFDDLLDLPWFWFWHAKVTRVDIALDVDGIKIDNYVFDRKNAPIRHVIAKHGVVETIYLGSNAKGQVRVYDKGRQLNDSSICRLRIEAVCRPQWLAKDLFGLKNVFGPVQVYDVLNADLQIGKLDSQLLHRAMQTSGLAVLKQVFPEKGAVNYGQIIKKSVPTFWSDQSFWSQWPTLLQAALPAQGMPECEYGHVDDDDIKEAA